MPLPADFSELPLEQQYALLDQHLGPHSLPELLAQLAALPDTAPLVQLARRSAAQWPPGFLLELQPLALQAVLELPGLEEPAARAWKQAHPAELINFCLLDRYLRRRQPNLWQDLRETAVHQAHQALAAAAQPDPGLLLRLPGSCYRELASQHPAGWQDWQPAWRSATRGAMALLAARPRDLSQANAERLLSSQVYTDPGHFLLELLQNADDAQATRFAVTFTSQEITVCHDGHPFDLRDLVGLLSIGQSTKQATQIGYFGVGFKSIYEVTRRPRLRSGHLALEIADISVPRPLAEFGDPALTTLVLPLKPDCDLEPLWRRALDVDPVLLLQLPHLRSLEWKRGDQEHRLSRETGVGDLAVLRHDGHSRPFHLWKGLYQHAGPRPVGKPQSAEIGLALPTDGQLPDTNLYSFLPVTESSGLRFIVGSHFDVPVDRERLDPASDWNRALIAALPDLIAQRVDAETLSLLPLPDDALAPLFQALPGHLTEALQGLPLAPGGRLPAELRLLHPELQPLFDVPPGPFLLDGQLLPLQPLEARQHAWLQLLGARPYDLAALLDDLPALPGRLPACRPADWALLHRLLARVEDAARLQSLPVLLDLDGRPAAPQTLCVLEPAWRALFDDPPPAVHPELARHADTQALLARLGVATFGWPELARRLQRRGPDGLHLEAFYALLPEAPAGIALTLLELPLFPDEAGELGPIATPATHQQGWVARHPDLPASLLPEFRFLAPIPELARCLEALGWPRLELAEALNWLGQPSPEQAELLLATVRTWKGNWTPQASTRLAALPIFAGSDGNLYPLDRLWRFTPPELQAQLPQLPALNDSHGVVARFNLNHVLQKASWETLLEAARPDTLPFLAGHARALTQTQLERLLARPLFDGRPIGEGGVQPVAPGFAEAFSLLGVAVLQPATQTLIHPLLDARGLKPLALPELLELLGRLPLQPAWLATLEVSLRAHAAELRACSEALRQSLPLWLNREGRLVPALDVPPDTELARLTGQPPAANDDPEWRSLFPPLDAAGFLQRRLDAEARPDRLLAEQPSWLRTVAAVDAVAVRLHTPLMTDAEGRLRTTTLYLASPSAHPLLAVTNFARDLLHPDSNQGRKAALIPPSVVLEVASELKTRPEIRQALYAFLQADLPSCLAEPEARQALATLPLWLSSRRSWKRLAELILDPDLPEDLGGDWTPHRELPLPLLEQLQRTLGLERPDPESLLRDHLLPAYLQSGGRAELLAVMARLAAPLPASTIRRLLRPPDGNAPFPLSGGIDLRDAYAPPAELSALPSLPPVSGQAVEFLRKLGLSPLPSENALRRLRLTAADGEALLGLVEWVHSHQAQQSLDLPWLDELRWLPDQNGQLKTPRQLFARSGELFDLVGEAPHLFAVRPLAAALAERLGLKTEADLDATLVLAHLRQQVERRLRPSGRLYRWLDAALADGRVTPHYLTQSLRDLPWIFTDEGEFRTPDQVLALPAFRLFGADRGTWDSAHLRFPHLAALFDIAEEVTPAVVLRYLDEVRHRPAPRVRLLRACLAFLGERLPADSHDLPFPLDWRVLPARAGERSEIVAASTPGLVRSNSPSLEALFPGLRVLDPGDPAQAPALERIYAHLRVPRLQDAYTVTADASGADLAEAHPEEVTRFRRLLRALAAMQPRIAAARAELDEGTWLVDERMRRFAASAPLEVRGHLTLNYELPGLPPTRLEAAAAYAPPAAGEPARLLVSLPAMQDPARHALPLAQGLCEIFYAGPGSEGLVDLLNLLVPLLDRESMDAYLDRRHFPRPTLPVADDAVSSRLADFLDFGFDSALARRHPALAEADWNRWRSSEPLPQDPAALLALLRVEATPALLAEVDRLVHAASLEEWSRQSADLEPDGEASEAAPASRALAVQASASARAPSAPVVPPFSGPAPSVGPPPGVPSDAWSAAGENTGARPSPSLAATPFATTEPSHNPLTRVLDRVSQWLGGGPSAGGGVALHHNVDALGDVQASYRQPPPRHLTVSSRNLRGSDLYCLHMLGVTFDARRQIYVPGPIPWPDTFLPSGRTVEFRGRLTLPAAHLPKPLHARLAQRPAVPVIGPDAQAQYRVTQDVELAYSVELSQPCRLTDQPAGRVDPGLLRLTAPASALPRLVHDWIDWARSSGLPPAVLAERARDFVLTRYLYDINFLADPDLRELAHSSVGLDENRALTLLHRAAVGRYLGRGVCFELSALLLELFRRVGIPAVLASVWMLDEGLIHRPDHAVVLAYLPTDRGPCWLPFDPSANRMEAGATGVPAAPPSRAQLLQAAADVVLGPAFHTPLLDEAREHALEQALLQALESQRQLALLLDFIASPRYVRQVDADLKHLVDRGWLQLDIEQVFRVTPPSH